MRPKGASRPKAAHVVQVKSVKDSLTFHDLTCYALEAGWLGAI
jgi:hypothetical protein